MDPNNICITDYQWVLVISNALDKKVPSEIYQQECKELLSTPYCIDAGLVIVPCSHQQVAIGRETAGPETPTIALDTRAYLATALIETNILDEEVVLRISHFLPISSNGIKPRSRVERSKSEMIGHKHYLKPVKFHLWKNSSRQRSGNDPPTQRHRSPPSGEFTWLGLKMLKELSNNQQPNFNQVVVATRCQQVAMTQRRIVFYTQIQDKMTHRYKHSVFSDKEINFPRGFLCTKFQVQTVPSSPAVTKRVESVSDGPYPSIPENGAAVDRSCCKHSSSGRESNTCDTILVETCKSNNGHTDGKFNTSSLSKHQTGLECCQVSTAHQWPADKTVRKLFEVSLGNVPIFAWRESGKLFLGTSPSVRLPPIPIIGSLVYCKNNALDHAATKGDLAV
uniref:Uncharacterized protein n=1 Tax=Timema poppense TaxID=170557 RepID=A0A7R9D6P7_TIMPO|nr:unnamed protein product [Timema poppensis]